MRIPKKTHLLASPEVEYDDEDGPDVLRSDVEPGEVFDQPPLPLGEGHLLLVDGADRHEGPDEDDRGEGHDRVEPNLAEDGHVEAGPQTQIL